MKRYFVIAALLLLPLGAACSKPAAAPAPAPEPPPAATPPPAAQRPAPPPVTEATPAEDPLLEFSLYRLDDVLAGNFTARDTYRFRTKATSMVLASDRETLLLFAADPYVLSTPPELLHLPTGKQTPLAVPGEVPGTFYCCGGWLPDGRLYLIGNGKFFVGDGKGGDIRPLADVSAWGAWLSPDTKRMALWKPGETGNASLIHLTTGARVPLPGSFRPQAMDGGSTLSWSPDGKQIAGTEGNLGGKPRIRIIDLGSLQEVRSIPGYVLIRWLPSGDLLAYPYPESLKGEQMLADLLDSEGKVKRKGVAAESLSPDGKWAAYNAYKQQNGLMEIATGEIHPLELPAVPSWAGPYLLYTVRRMQ